MGSALYIVTFTCNGHIMRVHWIYNGPIVYALQRVAAECNRLQPVGIALQPVAAAACSALQRVRLEPLRQRIGLAVGHLESPSNRYNANKHTHARTRTRAHAAGRILPQ